MNNRITIILVIVLSGLSCKDTTTAPTTDNNLLFNSTFEINGVPGLQGWTVPDTSVVHFSTDVPPSGSGHSIVLHAAWYGMWWASNSIYQSFTVPSGTHRYRLSVFGKSTGVPGRLFAFRNRPPGETSPVEFSSLGIVDTVWSFYSQTDTLTTIANDTLFVTIFGGGTESRGGTTYFNTCKFEKLD